MNEKEKELINDLCRLEVSKTDVEDTRRILASCGDLAETLGNPLVTNDEKRIVIERLFPENMILIFEKRVQR